MKWALVGEKDSLPKGTDSSQPLLMPKFQKPHIEDLNRLNQFLQKKLKRSETYRKRLESQRDLNSSLLRMINQEIDETRREAETANRKIMDSIHYAKMIQRSLLPAPDRVREYLPENFVIWMPRDVVSGDIIFADAHGCGGGVVIAVIDCTGHGVPGAFMTMIASSGLRQIIRDEGCHDPAQILKRLNVIVKTTLRQDMADAPSDDGLDAGMCFVEARGRGARGRKMIFAGARMPLIYVHNGRVKVIKGDKQSIGYKKSDMGHDFTTHRIPIEKGMRFYMVSDGFTDQLGGERDRRFGSRRFRELLRENTRLPFEKQREMLIRAFEVYRGENERQDDVTVVGFEG